MAFIAQQFGRPRGPLGRVIGHGMARSNGAFSRWVVDQVKGRCGDAQRIAELGPGPGVGIQAVLQQFPDATVWGVELSPIMLAQSRRRNGKDLEAGRLILLNGDASALSALAPLDVVMANHVLYFWHEPASEIAHIRQGLRDGGLIALGYQLRQSMPQMAQRRFPEEGHRLYDSNEQVADLLRAGGFTGISHQSKGPPEAAHGRLTLAVS